MITIKQASEHEFSVIRSIAHQTWPPTFGDILSEKQIDYMLEWMYSIPSLDEQVKKKGHTFLLAREDNHCLGFASYELNYGGESITKIHKLYVLPDTQGKGIGKGLINRIAETAISHRNTALSLNVNRNNPAVQFYQYLGFTIVGEENVSIGESFLMEDYIMKKQLRAKEG